MPVDHFIVPWAAKVTIILLHTHLLSHLPLQLCPAAANKDPRPLLSLCPLPALILHDKSDRGLDQL